MSNCTENFVCLVIFVKLFEKLHFKWSSFKNLVCAHLYQVPWLQLYLLCTINAQPGEKKNRADGCHCFVITVQVSPCYQCKQHQAAAHNQICINLLIRFNCSRIEGAVPNCSSTLKKPRCHRMIFISSSQYSSFFFFYFNILVSAICFLILACCLYILGTWSINSVLTGA